MKKLVKISFPALILLNVVTSVSAQVLDDIQTRFNTYQQNTLQEKLFAHIDKSSYTAGEILWFKLYDINNNTNKPIDASKVAYIEVIDKNNNAILQAKINLKNGMGDGSFYLPVSINTGYYKVRAYTNWMKNFSPDKYFEKNIAIINSLKEITFQPKPVDADYDVQFFPEGGNLVNNLTNNVAFRVTANNGMGIDFSGAIINKNNDTVLRFKPYKFGIGNFAFKPEASDVYRAVIKLPGDKTITAPLPEIESRGYALKVSNANANQLMVTVNTSIPQSGPIYLIIHNRANITVAKSSLFTNNMATFLIDRNNLSEGISNITLFNSEKQPVCERLYMKRPGSKLIISAAPAQNEYATRKEVALNIQANYGAAPAEANMSIAVYRLDSLENNTPESIYTYLWLSSELKGNVESPEYYLSNNDDEALDNLMLTHGWSKYNWTDVLQAKTPAFKYLPELEGHLITGKVTDPKSNTSVKNENLFLSVPGKRVQLYNSQTDSLGNFLVNTKDFWGQNELVVQPRLEQDTLFKIQVLNPFSEHFSTTKLPDFNLQKDLYGSISTRNIDMQVQNLYSGEKIKQQYLPLIDTTSFFNGLQKEYLLDNYVRFSTMEEVLREYVHEVLVSKSKDQFKFRVISENYYMNGVPLIIFDGIPVYNPNKIIAADPLKVRRLEVVPAIYYRGNSTDYGILSFNTYKSDLGGVDIDPHALVIDYEGLQLKRSFFSPIYETPAQVSSHLPDFRTLLYWSPDLQTDKNGKASFNFYTSDQTGKYMGVVQGITAEGKAGMQSFSFEVKQTAMP